MSVHTQCFTWPAEPVNSLYVPVALCRASHPAGTWRTPLSGCKALAAKPFLELDCVSAP